MSVKFLRVFISLYHLTQNKPNEKIHSFKISGKPLLVFECTLRNQRATIMELAKLKEKFTE